LIAGSITFIPIVVAFAAWYLDLMRRWLRPGLELFRLAELVDPGQSGSKSAFVGSRWTPQVGYLGEWRLSGP
jgi:hypothetical protein